MNSSDISTIRRGERAACVDQIRRMAIVANRAPHGVSFEGGIDAQDAARILEACAREIEGAFEATATDIALIPTNQENETRPEQEN